MVRDEWPKIRADVDAGHPSPIGLITVKSSDPFDLKEDHQVLVFGYDLDGGAVTLRLYDPNQPGRDDITLRFETGDPTRPQTLAVTPGGPPVLAFFRVAYVRRDASVRQVLIPRDAACTVPGPCFRPFPGSRSDRRAGGIERWLYVR